MTTTERASKREALLDALAQHTGTTQWYRHWSRCFVYTDGVHCLAERAGAYWLIDLIASWCADARIRRAGFVVWTLTVRPDQTAVAIATDGGKHELARQDIEWTNFPLDEITLYFTDNTLLLPSED